MADETNGKIATDLQAWIEDLCIVARYLPAMYVREQLDQIDELMTVFNVEVELPKLPGWRSVVLKEPPQLVEGENGYGLSELQQADDNTR